MESKPKKQRKPQLKKTGSHPRKKRQPKPAGNLPEPIDVAAARVAEKQPEKPEGLLSEIGSLFNGADSPGAQEQSAAPSANSSTGSIPDSLPPESERILAGVPETIGAEPDDPGAPADVPINDDPIAALMAQVAFEPQDVQDVLAEFFDWMAERFASDHWKLTERQARMLGRPAAQMLNALWVRLQQYIPDILGRWCEETPGAMAFIVACGIVVAPKITRQVQISRERAKAKPLVQDKPQPKPPQPQPIRPERPAYGIVFDNGGE